MSSAVKWFCGLVLALSAGWAGARDLYVFVIGQSISANCNERMYPVAKGVYQIGLDGAEKPARDPFEWSDCKRGSMWVPLGEKILKAGMADRVVFMPIGVQATKVSDWLEGGRAYKKLMKAIDMAKSHNISFDFALFHQGSSDIGTPKGVYEENLNRLIDDIGAELDIDKWIVAQHSSCFGHQDAKIALVQQKITADLIDNIYLGPNTNALDRKYRFDDCHLNAKGQDEMAKLWLLHMQKADTESLRLKERSALFYYFR